MKSRKTTKIEVISRLPISHLQKELILSLYKVEITFTDNVENIEQSIDDVNSRYYDENTVIKSCIYTTSDNEFIYTDVKKAFRRQTKLIIDNQITATTGNAFQSALILLELAKKDGDIYTETNNCVYHALRQFPAKMNLDDLNMMINKNVSKEKSAILISRINKEIEEKTGFIKTATSITNKNVEYIDIDYSDKRLVKLLMRKGIHALVGGTGTGKTSKALLPVFEKASNKNMYPIFVNSSRALAKSMLDSNDSRFYMSEKHAENAVLGVALKIFTDKSFETIREKSSVLIMDEVEDVFDLLTSEIAGNNLQERININDKLDQQIQKSDTVIISDAFTSDESLARIIKNANGKKVFVYRQTSKFKKPVVRVMTKPMCIAKAMESLSSNKKIGVFCDAKHQADSKLNALVNTIKESEGIYKLVDSTLIDTPKTIARYTLIDGAFMNSENAEQLADTKQFASDNQAIIYNSAAKNGLSIIDENYKEVFLFSHATVSPNDLIQASHRFRNVEKINICFIASRVKNDTNADSVKIGLIHSELTDEFCNTKFDELRKNSVLSSIASRIAFKNKLRTNYEFSVLNMFESCGYEIQYLTISNKKIRSAKRAILAGAKEEKDTRYSNIKSAEKITCSEAQAIRIKSEETSMQNKFALESHDLRTFYRINEIDDYILDFDKSGQGRRFIKNMMLARDTLKIDERNISISDKFKIKLIHKFFEITGTSTGDCMYSNERSDAFNKYVLNETIKIGNRTMKASTVFKNAFSNSSISRKRTMNTVASVLKNEFGIQAVKTSSRKKGNWIYIAESNFEAEALYSHIVA